MSIKTDNTATLVNALAEIERLQGRVAELENVLRVAWSQHCLEAVDWPDAADAILRNSESESFVLRRQAEGAEWIWGKYCRESVEEDCMVIYEDDMRDAISCLRNQADELESNNEQEH